MPRPQTQVTTPKWLISVAVATVMGFGFSSAVADTAENPASFTKSLSWLTGNTDPIKFRDETSNAGFSVPEPANLKFNSVTLHLLGINSAALEAKASSILVSVNGEPAAVLPLDGNTPQIDSLLTLSGRFFASGYNQINLRAVQTTGVSCEKFDSPALWTRLSANSTIAISSESVPVVPNFNALGKIFDKHVLAGKASVTLLYNDAAAHDPDVLIGAAQGIGLRYDYVPIQITAETLTPDHLLAAITAPGNVVILNSDGLGTNVNGKETANLSLQPKTGGTILRIGGSNVAVAAAGRLIGSDTIAWPASATTQIDINNKDHENIQRTPSMFFRTLGFNTVTVPGPESSFGPITFWNDDWGSHAVISLHLVPTIIRL